MEQQQMQLILSMTFFLHKDHVFLEAGAMILFCHVWELRGSSDALLTDAYLTLFKSILTL